MGGVRGKSQGCGTCRARKIACGQERPSCSQCLKSNRQCLGYRRDRVFVLVQPGAKESSRTTRQDHANNQIILDQGPGNVIIMSCHIRQRLLDEFIGRCLPHTRFLSPKHYRPWLFLLPDIPTRSKALEFSTLAISCAALGRKFQDTALIHQSLKAYTRGLREMQRALWNASLMHDNETLAACLVLSLYELMECPDNGADAYLSHCRGFLSLIKARGMDAHTAGIGHDLFLGVRLQGILDAIGHRVPNFLCDRAWCQDPWTSRPKRMADRIADCLADIPSILQRYDQLSSLNRADILNSTYLLVGECLRIDQTLQDIYEAIRLEVSGPLYWPVLSQSFQSSAPGQGQFSVVYNFPDLKTATLLMLYWASKALLWATLSNLYDVIQLQDLRGAAASIVEVTSEKHNLGPNKYDESSPDRDSPTRDDGQNYMSMARNVCQSLEYCLQEDMSLLGIFAASTPVIIAIWAIRYRQNDEAELAWLMGVSQKMHQGLRMWPYI